MPSDEKQPADLKAEARGIADQVRAAVDSLSLVSAEIREAHRVAIFNYGTACALVGLERVEAAREEGQRAAWEEAIKLLEDTRVRIDLDDDHDYDTELCDLNIGFCQMTDRLAGQGGE